MVNLPTEEPTKIAKNELLANSITFPERASDCVADRNGNDLRVPTVFSINHHCSVAVLLGDVKNQPNFLRPACRHFLCIARLQTHPATTSTLKFSALLVDQVVDTTGRQNRLVTVLKKHWALEVSTTESVSNAPDTTIATQGQD
jgi:hypothetical protein